MILSCDDCKLPLYDIFMLIDELWIEITKGDINIMLCMHCAMRRLGRKFTSKDFKNARCNEKYIILLDGINAKQLWLFKEPLACFRNTNQ